MGSNSVETNRPVEELTNRNKPRMSELLENKNLFDLVEIMYFVL